MRGSPVLLIGRSRDVGFVSCGTSGGRRYRSRLQVV